MKRLLIAFALTAGAAAPALGDEADLTRRIAQAQSELAAVDQRLDRLEAQLQNQGLIGLLNQINALKQETARLRGVQEEQAHQLAQAEQRQKTLYADLDERMKELAGHVAELRAALQASQAANPSRPPPAESVRLQPAKSLSGVSEAAPEPVTDVDTRSYDAALSQFKAGDYQGAVKSFQTFYGKHAASQLAPNALYWMGLAYAVQGDYGKAAAAYEKLIAEHATSSKVPDAMVSLGRAFLQMGDPAAARAQLEGVVSKYPTSRSAETARKLLSTFE
ncbi:MAG TPA: tol-pal system protein YbgF [Thiobacillaceae bacterium]|nr:tol-pal system protein YbgF [Thiobacillaceae bacterium]